MNPRPVDIKELERQELRVRAYREKQWDKLDDFNPFEKAILTVAVGAALALLVLVGGIIIWAKWIA
jgi:hypothetical protein